MKQSYLTLTLCLILFALLSMAFKNRTAHQTDQSISMQEDSLLRHVVLFKFKPETTKEDIKKVEEAFTALPAKIPQIVGYEWGLNNSPEGLNQGFTHCFFLTFNSEEDRAVYLPHPDHKAFGDILGPHLDDVLVVDYWAK
ncbi:Dabb family protein [Zobellia galactanivorans]|uniref:Dabb family protein n=1 Tax=Zobellia galactanivorans (strain DSM 12802 / CCUG 47099 / CIP 106680 / NCIMB 13871 / Dsij) TaxID=63186 RepID=UPI0026E2A931|nr:Dabb family protein [Zobellia galactanivorans]MDO6810324.1 Dabb family protein [Zobellia galactanivorans]